MTFAVLKFVTSSDASFEQKLNMQLMSQTLDVSKPVRFREVRLEQSSNI